MAKERGAVLQMEFDIARFTEKGSFQAAAYGEEPWHRVFAIAKTAVVDVIRNRGTFVLVNDGRTITLVQRPDAEPMPRIGTGD